MSKHKNIAQIFIFIIILIITTLHMFYCLDAKLLKNKKISSIKEFKNQESLNSENEMLVTKKIKEIKNLNKKYELNNIPSLIQTKLNNTSSIFFKINNDQTNKYDKAINITCNKTNCLYPNYCSLDKTICNCGMEFAEYDLYHPETNTKISDSNQTTLNSLNNTNSNVEKYIYCNYIRKKQVLYFLFEFFSNIGVGHLYAKNYILAAIKFGVVFFTWLFIYSKIICVIFWPDSFKDITGNRTFMGIIFISISFLLWITDTILIGKNIFADGNGVRLLEW